MLGLVGRKEGTLQIYRDDQAVQATFITVLPHHITQIKTLKKDGYQAVQLTTGQKAIHKVNGSERGQYKKANIEKPGLGLWEFPLDREANEFIQALKVGGCLTVDHFKKIKYVDVSGFTKGKGFAGVIKRHHFSSQDATHGNSLSHRAPGSIGQRTDPSRVFKNKKMPGHLGNKRRTVPSLEVIAIYPDQNLLVIKGSIPGAPGGLVEIKPSIRMPYLDTQNNQAA